MLQIGDTIRCRDIDDLVDTMTELAKAGVETDFDYTDGVRLIVTEVIDNE